MSRKQVLLLGLGVPIEHFVTFAQQVVNRGIVAVVPRRAFEAGQRPLNMMRVPQQAIFTHPIASGRTDLKATFRHKMHELFPRLRRLDLASAVAQPIRYFSQSGLAISTRRFLARPSSVSLLATGIVLP